MICDLRDFTTISELWPRDYVIDLLNAYFDALSGADRGPWRRDPEIHGRRPARHLPARAVPTACADLLAAIGRAKGRDGGTER